jgi:hypothetical protein
MENKLTELADLMPGSSWVPLQEEGWFTARDLLATRPGLDITSIHGYMRKLIDQGLVEVTTFRNVNYYRKVVKDEQETE